MKGKPTIEYRAACAAHKEYAGDEASSVHHTHRTRSTPTRAWAEDAAKQQNEAPRTGPSSEVYRLCVPWHVEARIITGWMGVDDAETIANANLGQSA